MVIIRLTIQPLLYFVLCNRFIPAIVLRLYRLQDYGDFWVGIASTVRLHFAIDDRSAGITLFASRDSTVERHEKGVGIPARGRIRSIMCV
jgi:hypothetical protein